ncbi:cell division protein ZapE [Microbacterium gorillae]|uniref:cell division protein ZapE n=1 Tax=Microbacterium gorillae TaxID=1231063 RepID=UPI00059137B8|nr:cell division protein ZapE [Microbacterium gorillae]
MTATARTTFVHLTDRNPQLSGAEMVASLVPPPQFDGATFDTYRTDAEYPSQQGAKDLLVRFCSGGGTVKRGGLFSRRKNAEPEMKPGVYLDGGFGVGKTHLLAATYHAFPANRKYFGSFIEYTALVGALGYRNAVDLFRGSGLLCIDEFELDDPGDTMVMTRFLGELVASGTKVAATSNTPPNALGEGRFAAQDFLREIQAMSDAFQTVRIDGVDYRQRAIDGTSITLDQGAYDAALAEAARGGAASDDVFDDVIRHLATVHPSRYIRLVEGLNAVGLRDVRQLTDQSEALRFVALVDRIYDAQTPVRATGLGLNDVFSEEMLGGGYRKKYLRAVSRLNAQTHA